ncbi:hypothetical protein K9N68_36890 (plasmid) [Kovacikia minuta CCNUW1]|uniref:hypothetical protein n=1 Tax=Kovacikia minuta TaxID=2931930 RepID=UPI001CC9B6F5|nr:hypothetical protein [Kovacikia minuta]UBF29805.1 hypothetical protein K9N68_36890 [Kovacikia minuta CCNUW1]
MIHPLTTQLAELFRKRVRRGGTRSGTVCVVTPDLGGKNLWSDRPLILWQDGEVARVQVRSIDSKTLVWDQPLSSSQTSTIYNGAPLQPGQTYEVVLLDDKGKSIVRDTAMLPQFVLLDRAKRTDISQKLKEIENQITAKQGTVEDVVAAKAQYLLDQENLVSDAFQMVYTAQPTSPELKQMTQQITAIACGSDESSATNGKANPGISALRASLSQTVQYVAPRP